MTRNRAEAGAVEAIVPATNHAYRIQGSRFGVEHVRDLPRLVAASAALLGPAALGVIAMGKAGRARTAEAMWARAARRLLGVRLDVGGTDHIDPGRTYIVAPLHEGFFDIPALLHLPLRLRFAARDELAEWALLGAGLRSGRHPLIEPESSLAAYRTLVREAPLVRDAGESLVVFPQGTLLGIESAFTRGAFALAESTDQPILPVVITGSHRVWEHPFRPTVRFGRRVRIEVLPPLDPPFATDRIRAIEREMKQRALQSDVPPRRYRPERDGFWDGYRFEIDPDFPEVAAAVAEHRGSVAAT